MRELTVFKKKHLSFTGDYNSGTYVVLNVHIRVPDTMVVLASYGVFVNYPNRKSSSYPACPASLRCRRLVKWEVLCVCVILTPSYKNVRSLIRQCCIIPTVRTNLHCLGFTLILKSTYIEV